MGLGTCLVIANVQHEIDEINHHIDEINQSIASSKGALISISGQRELMTTNMYLDVNEVFSNIHPFIVPFNAQIIYILAADKNNSTWVAELRKEDQTVIPNCFVDVSSGYTDKTVAVSVLKGSKISLYCNGQNVKQPKIYVLLKKL